MYIFAVDFKMLIQSCCANHQLSFLHPKSNTDFSVTPYKIFKCLVSLISALITVMFCKAPKSDLNSFPDLQCVFTSQTDFMKFAGDDNCPFCIRSVQASEKHLVKKHFLSAVHFVVDGTGEVDTKLKWNMRLCSNNILISIQTLKKAAIVSLSRAVCHSM